jgi:hypothetical protein
MCVANVLTPKSVGSPVKDTELDVLTALRADKKRGRYQFI